MFFATCCLWWVYIVVFLLVLSTLHVMCVGHCARIRSKFFPPKKKKEKTPNLSIAPGWCFGGKYREWRSSKKKHQKIKNYEERGEYLCWLVETVQAEGEYNSSFPTPKYPFFFWIVPLNHKKKGEHTHTHPHINLLPQTNQKKKKKTCRWE